MAWLNTGLLVLILLCSPLFCFAQIQPADLTRLRLTFDHARAHYTAAPKDAVAAWQFGRAALDLADALDDNQERHDIAILGVDACRHAIDLDANSAVSHYYLGLNLGQLARAKKISALKTLHEMEHELLKAQQLDSAFDYAGPDRSVGMLYLEAPAWPVSVGNRNKARSRLEAAVQLSPDYPENHICLAEAYARWGELKNLETELQRTTALLPQAQARFTGPDWTLSWRDWEQRLQKLQKTREHLAGSPRISPAERGAHKGK